MFSDRPQTPVAMLEAAEATFRTYRGSHWEARHVGTGHPVPGLHVIRAVEGNHLLLERATH